MKKKYPKRDVPLRLSTRHLEIINLIRKGLGNKPIGTKLHISEKTVKYHLTKIYKFLKVTSRLELSVLIAGLKLNSTDEIGFVQSPGEWALVPRPAPLDKALLPRSLAK